MPRLRLLAAASLTTALAVVGGALVSAPAAWAEPEFDLPVTMLRNNSGGWTPTTQISINGSDPILVGLDTGTAQLVVNPGALQNVANPYSPAYPVEPVMVNGTPLLGEVVYDGSGVHGVIATGTVSVESFGVTYASPAGVNFLEGTDCTFDGVTQCPNWVAGMQGVMGLGPVQTVSPDGDPAHDLYSAVMQFGAPSDAGFTIDLRDLLLPTIHLGPVATAAGDTVLDRVHSGRTRSNTLPVFEEPQMCWSISTGPGVASGCLQTVIDSGQVTGVITGSQWDGVVTPVQRPPNFGSGRIALGEVPSGALVSWATPGGEVFAGIPAGTVEQDRWSQFVAAPGKPPISNDNTGAEFYRRHVVGFDAITGHVVIGPTTGVPAAPVVEAVAPAGMGALTATWSSSETVAQWAVAVRDDTGALVQRFAVAGDARSATIGGLVAGRTYAVAVAGITTPGLGRFSGAVSARVELPLTGGDAVPVWPGLALLALGGALLVAGRRRRSAA